MTRKTPMTCTVQEAADLTGLSCYYLRSLVNSESIIAVKSGRKTFINRESLLRFVNGDIAASPKNESNEISEFIQNSDNLYELRKANGICIDCRAAMAEQGKTRCKACSEKHNAQRKKREEIRRDQGICIKCGKALVSNGSDYCEKCIQKQKEHSDKNRCKELSEKIRALEVENAELKSTIRSIQDTLSAWELQEQPGRCRNEQNDK